MPGRNDRLAVRAGIVCLALLAACAEQPEVAAPSAGSALVTAAPDCPDPAERPDPGPGSAWYNRGNALRDLGENRRAIESYDEALRRDRCHYRAWYNRGNALRDVGENREAIESYDRTLAIAPDHVKAYNNRGLAYADLGEHVRAIEDYDRAIALDPQHKTAYNNRGNAYRELGRPRRAIEDYDRAIALDPDYALAWYNRGNALRDLGTNREAVESYDRAVAIEPDYAKAWYNRANALRDLGENARAVESYDRAIQLRSDVAAETAEPPRPVAPAVAAGPGLAGRIHALMMDEMPAYRSLPELKVVAACIDWDSPTEPPIQVRNVFVTYTGETSDMPIFLTSLANDSLHRCRQWASANDEACTCQMLDQNGKNVLKVPE